VGEFVTSGNVSASQTTGSTNNLASISLTAGDWDVDGAIQYVCTAATLIDAYACVSTTSLDTSQSNMATAPWQRVTMAGNASQAGVHPPPLRLSLSARTTVYLVAFCQFSSGTMTANGVLTARRVRCNSV
jgi:hypothetical protein